MTSNFVYLQPKDIRHIHQAILQVTSSVIGELHNGLDSLCQTAQVYHENRTLEGLAAFVIKSIGVANLLAER